MISHVDLDIDYEDIEEQEREMRAEAHDRALNELLEDVLCDKEPEEILEIGTVREQLLAAWRADIEDILRNQLD